MNKKPDLEQALRSELELLAEPQFQKFSSSLIPGCENMLGVRIPKIRAIAKREAGYEPLEYLHKDGEVYFEELILKGLIIGFLKTDIETTLEEVRRFIPKVNNWSVCDTFCAGFKQAKKHQAEVWAFIAPYLRSERDYDLRVAIVMLLDHFIDREHISAVLKILNEVQHDSYYVKMAVAWALSVCYVKFPEETMALLQDNQLDDFTYNKTLQKICESLRVSTTDKEIMRSMKRKCI